MPPDPPASAPLPTIGDHYLLVEKLGEGAFGEVYRARHDLLGQEFAVKLLKPEMSESKDSRDRFLDEARALIAFSHPGVVQVRHVGEANGRLYLVMDLVRGRPLDEILKEGSAFPEKRAVDLVLQALSGLEAAHAAGIVHRDIKPSNMLVETRPDGGERLKILDFGLSKLAGVDGLKGAHRSVTGTIVGTLAYMSPEQIKGEADIDGRSDVFAIGLVLMEMLQGHHPYPGESGILVAAKILRDPLPTLDAKVSGRVSAATRSALARALERDRDARFASAAAFAQALQGRGPPSDTSKVTTVQEAQRELARLEAQRRREAGPAPRSRTGLVVGAVVALLALGGAAAFFLGQRGDEEKNGKEVAESPPSPAPPPPGPDRPEERPETPSKPPSPLPEPAQPEPATPTPEAPANPEPEPATPEAPTPVPPTPEKPAPEAPEPGPVAPEPGPEAPSPEPAPGFPTATGPTPEVAKPTPPSPPPETTEPATPASHSAEQLVQQGLAEYRAGRWKQSREAYLAALADKKAPEAIHVGALRGIGSAWLTEADVRARSGDPAAALQELDRFIAWVSKRWDDFNANPHADDNTQRLRAGFAILLRAEAHVEQARWHALEGRKDEVTRSLKRASDDFEFAVQQLSRDGVNYWELLLRRSEMFRVSGKSQEMLNDLQDTTKINNEIVPAHMWVAHVNGLRRVVDSYLSRGDRENATKWAEMARRTAADAAAWKEDEVTREQWFDLARPLFLLGVSMPEKEDPTAIHGQLDYFVRSASRIPAVASLPAPVAEAQMKTAQATERWLRGQVERRQGKADAAKAAFGESVKLASEAIAGWEAAAKAGAILPVRLPYFVLESALLALGRTEEAQRAAQAGLSAARRNPD
jgi:serine/threonine-protein kinase